MGSFESKIRMPQASEWRELSTDLKRNFNFTDEGLDELKDTFVWIDNFISDEKTQPGRKERLCAAEQMLEALKKFEAVYLANERALKRVLHYAHYDLANRLTLTALHASVPEQTKAKVRAWDERWRDTEDPIRCLLYLENLTESMRASLGLSLGNKLVPFILSPLRDDLENYVTGRQKDKGGFPKDKVRSFALSKLIEHYHSWTKDYVTGPGSRFLDFCQIVLPRFGIQESGDIRKLVHRHLRSLPELYMPEENPAQVKSQKPRRKTVEV